MPEAEKVNDAEAFGDLLEQLGSHVAALTVAADRAIRAVHPQATRVVWPHQRTIGYGIGPKKMSEHYAYLDIYDNHINIGFNHGASLPDPHHLLGGTGKRMRSLRVTSPEDVERAALAELIAAALEERQTARGR